MSCLALVVYKKVIGNVEQWYQYILQCPWQQRWYDTCNIIKLQHRIDIYQNGLVQS
jgi:hypothetical protein